ncbi:hypothetical protein [Actinophytocola xanthii]|uniref:DUF305 domain-containing protein n=1 Tax=Actinophytocola xanthii TaxID=1912961 RepID=A0A1Q8CLH2_9PSEU|nr:hypothetical protein [Actinophytocola xanthii]OLF15218.1 hypothetical protein BU204_22975 [Actinophytocola xanthii]
MTDAPALLGVYLNDHLAGATAGMELSRRLARNEGNWAGELTRIAEEIAEDRAALQDLMRTLGVQTQLYKPWLAWIGEKATRLKPNRRFASRSPLSRVIELETMRLGVLGKGMAWRALREAGDPRLPAERLERLIERADRQADELEKLRQRAAAEVFGR